MPPVRASKTDLVVASDHYILSLPGFNWVLTPYTIG